MRADDEQLSIRLVNVVMNAIKNVPKDAFQFRDIYLDEQASPHISEEFRRNLTSGADAVHKGIVKEFGKAVKQTRPTWNFRKEEAAEKILEEYYELLGDGIDRCLASGTTNREMLRLMADQTANFNDSVRDFMDKYICSFR